MAVPAELASVRPSPVVRLCEAMGRLAAELDGARLYQAAAYVSMAADSLQAGAPAATEAGGGSRIPELPQGRLGRDDGSEREVDLDFTLDEQGRVWMIRDGDRHLVGPTEAVCGEMRRFLAGVAAGGDGYGQRDENKVDPESSPG